MKVKKGWLAVQVEEETEEAGGVGSQRFVIPISYLCHPLFKHLLDKAYEVYGYHTEGPLKLPCSVDDFLHLRWRIQKESSTHHHHNHNHNHHHHRQLPHAFFLESEDSPELMWFMFTLLIRTA
ncbi:Auxin-responsive protein SAUR32 [Glycine max]|nr:Auxin-responsive protein SAUR32 [Glycine max]